MRHLCAFLLAVTSSAASSALAQDPVAPDTAPPSTEKSYAADNGLSVEEARRRLDELRETRRLAGELRTNESDTFGGIYVDHRPEFKITVLFTESAAEKLKKYKVPRSVVPATARQSEKALRQEQADLLKGIRENGGRVAAQTRVRAGEIDLFTDDEAGLNAAMAKGNIKLDKKVKIKKVKAMKWDGEAAIYGGYPLKEGAIERCTAGFALTDGTKRYISTAGHCADTLNYNGSPLPWVAQRWGTIYDFQVNGLGTNTVTNAIYVGSSVLQRITSAIPYEWIFEDDYVCKYGRATFYTCGYVLSTDYSGMGAGGFIRVHKAGANMSSGGDSGAPWYVSTYSEAWGIHSDDVFEDPNDAFFMPASRFADANFQVLTQP
ncbi:MAG TPA: S1 family peptidase [Allosphingosinicella sp.]|nr:S1 family peptidase [Allosphingosinicella sp.]